VDVLIPWETVGATIPVRPQLRNSASNIEGRRYNFRSIPPHLKSASYLHMRGIRVTIQRVSPAASQNKWAARFALMRRTRT
jgi:hypothetical protein